MCCTAVHCNALHHTATLCNSLQRVHLQRMGEIFSFKYLYTCICTHMREKQRDETFKYSGFFVMVVGGSSALPHSATHCNTLQRTATLCNTLQRKRTSKYSGFCMTAVVDGSALQHCATHCNTLQHSATPCNTLQ